MTIRRFVVATAPLFLLPTMLFAQGRLKFTVDLLNTDSHEVHVTLVPTGFHAKIAYYQMPIWAPGAYGVTGYGRYLRNFKAFNTDHHILKAVQIDSNRSGDPLGSLRRQNRV